MVFAVFSINFVFGTVHIEKLILLFNLLVWDLTNSIYI